MKVSEKLDEQLASQAKAGDFAAFEELTGRYEGRVYALALRMLGQVEDAQDATQQTFLSAMESIKGFRGEASFSIWLLRIASHAALKIIRKRKGLPTISLDGALENAETDGRIPHPEFIADWRYSPEELVNRREIGTLLDDALKTLDEKHRLIFLLRDVEGLSIAETAAVLGLTEANVKVRLLRARLQLREILTRELGGPENQLTQAAH